MKKVMWMWCDGDGKPRAWGAGAVENEEAVKDRANRELTAYVAGRRELGEAISERDFTPRRVEYDEEPVEFKGWGPAAAANARAALDDLLVALAKAGLREAVGEPLNRLVTELEPVLGEVDRG